MKIPVISISNKVRSNIATYIHLLSTTIIEGNVKFQLGISENKREHFPVQVHRLSQISSEALWGSLDFR